MEAMGSKNMMRDAMISRTLQFHDKNKKTTKKRGLMMQKERRENNKIDQQKIYKKGTPRCRQPVKP